MITATEAREITQYKIPQGIMNQIEKRIFDAAEAGKTEIEWRGNPLCGADYSALTKQTKSFIEQFKDFGYDVKFIAEAKSMAVDLYIKISW